MWLYRISLPDEPKVEVTVCDPHSKDMPPPGPLVVRQRASRGTCHVCGEDELRRLLRKVKPCPAGSPEPAPTSPA